MTTTGAQVARLADERDRRLCATRNRAASTVRRAQSRQFWLVLRSRRAFIEA